MLALMEARESTEACVVSLDGNQAVRVPLMECVERTKAVAQAMEERQWVKAVELRGRSFARNLETYKMLTRLKPPKDAFDADGKGVVRIEDGFYVGSLTNRSLFLLNHLLISHHKTM